MRILKSNPQSGFSLIEIFIVLVMIGILTTLALMQWGTARTDFQRQRIAREFKIYLERARFDSVKRRAEGADVAKIELINNQSFRVTLDFDGDGTLSAGEVRTINFADRTDAVIQVSGDWTYPVTLAFNRKGLVNVDDDGEVAVTPVFTICSDDCSPGSTDVTRIAVSTSGTVAELRPGQNPETLPTPSNSNNSFPVRNCYVLAANTNWNGCSEF